MASGLGPNLILPGGRQLWGNLTGTTPWNGQPGQQDWFGLQDDPMQWNAALMDAGRRGQLMSRGPQSGTWTPPTEGSWNQISTPFGVNSALLGSSFNPAAGQGAYDRFNDVGASYLRRYGTDVKADAQGNTVLPMLDDQGNQVGFGQGTRPNPAYADAQLILASPERGAGYRSGALFGGRDGFDQPLTGVRYGGHQNFTSAIGLQQGANPFLNNPTLAAQMSQFQELGSPFARADPANYLQTMLGAEGQYPSTGDIGAGYADLVGQQGFGGINQMRAMAQRGYGNVTNDTEGLVNSYERDLMRQMAAEGSKDLALGLQDTQNTMAAMGLGRSGQAQTTAGGMWRDIQERNALDRQNLMAQFAEAGMGREAQAMLGMGQAGLEANRAAILQAQQGGIQGWLAAQEGAIQGNESRLGRANQAAMSGLNALTGSLEASRAAERAQLMQGMDRTSQWNLGTQGNYLQSLLGHDQAALNRMVAESQEQSRGMQDYMTLQREKDAMYNDRLNQMLGLEDRYRTSQNEVYNQMAQYGQLPMQYLMSMVTGISPTGGSPARTSPWGSIAGQLGGAAIGAAPQAYSMWQNQYDPQLANRED